MNILNRLGNYFEKNRAQRFLEGVQAWHQTCSAITRILGEALNNEDITQGDIGVVLDNTDRKLFALRNEIADVQGPLRHYNPALARRVSSTSRDIFQLRNETARFLIRSQGPSPETANQPGGLEMRRMYYYRAMDEKGFKARQMQVQVDRELKSVWEELQKTIHSVEKSMAG